MISAIPYCAVLQKRKRVSIKWSTAKHSEVHPHWLLSGIVRISIGQLGMLTPKQLVFFFFSAVIRELRWASEACFIKGERCHRWRVKPRWFRKWVEWRDVWKGNVISPVWQHWAAWPYTAQSEVSHILCLWMITCVCRDATNSCSDVTGSDRSLEKWTCF